jgi:YD repeat-containing protein
LNSSLYGSITSTSACTPGAPGPDGNDQITKLDYTANSLVSAKTEAYGTSDARVTFTKTFNNTRTLARVVDAKGNRTSYTYDHFGRLTKTCFATPSNGAIPSTTDCEQRTFSPASGLLASLILRDGQAVTMGYDAVGRLSCK